MSCGMKPPLCSWAFLPRDPGLISLSDVPPETLHQCFHPLAIPGYSLFPANSLPFLTSIFAGTIPLASKTSPINTILRGLISVLPLYTAFARVLN